VGQQWLYERASMFRLRAYTPVFFRLINTQSNNTDGDMKIQGSIPVTHSRGPEFKSRSEDQPSWDPSSAPPITCGTVPHKKLWSLHSATFLISCSLITPPPHATSSGLTSLLTHIGVILLSSRLPCLSRSTRARICVPQCRGVGSHTHHRDYRGKIQGAEPFLKKVKLTLFTP